MQKEIGCKWWDEGRAHFILFYKIIPHPCGNEKNVFEINFCDNIIPQDNI